MTTGRLPAHLHDMRAFVGELPTLLAGMELPQSYRTVRDELPLFESRLDGALATFDAASRR